MAIDGRIQEYSLDNLVSETKLFDTLVLSASFEERSKTLAETFAYSRSGRIAVALCANNDSVEKTYEHEKHISSLFTDVTPFQLSKKNPIDTADGFLALADWLKSNDKKNVLVDVTCFTHEAMLILVKVLHEYLAPSINVSLAYVPARSYDEETAKESEIWLSRGLKEIRSILGYAGELVPSKDIHLIVLVGFDSERTLRLIEEYQPATLSLGLGSNTPFKDEFLSINKHFFKEIKAIYPNYETFEFSPSCPFQVSGEIEKVAQMHPDKNTVISTMNTKVSALGVARAISKNPNIQACYTLPIIYNHDHYSVPSDRCMIMSLSDLFL